MRIDSLLIKLLACSENVNILNCRRKWKQTITNKKYFFFSVSLLDFLSAVLGKMDFDHIWANQSFLQGPGSHPEAVGFN
jgi:hypothetical protein